MPEAFSALGRASVNDNRCQESRSGPQPCDVTCHIAWALKAPSPHFPFLLHPGKFLSPNSNRRTWLLAPSQPSDHGTLKTTTLSILLGAPLEPLER